MLHQKVGVFHESAFLEVRPFNGESKHVGLHAKVK